MYPFYLQYREINYFSKSLKKIVRLERFFVELICLKPYRTFPESVIVIWLHFFFWITNEAYKKTHELISRALVVTNINNCDPDWIQTNDPQLRRLLLYSAELPDQAVANVQVLSAKYEELSKNALRPKSLQYTQRSLNFYK